MIRDILTELSNQPGFDQKKHTIWTKPRRLGRAKYGHGRKQDREFKHFTDKSHIALRATRCRLNTQHNSVTNGYLFKAKHKQKPCNTQEWRTSKALQGDNIDGMPRMEAMCHISQDETWDPHLSNRVQQLKLVDDTAPWTLSWDRLLLHKFGQQVPSKVQVCP